MKAHARENPRFVLLDMATQGTRRGFEQDVRDGLLHGPKRLSCKYFYDEDGSELFEEICALEEYYLPRAEREILETRAAEIAAKLPRGGALIELGSGSSAKTRLLITALLSRLGGGGRLRYVPIDVSRTMLEESSRALVEEYAQLEVTAIAAEYEAGLDRLARLDPPLGAKLFLWLGSNIGNFDRAGAAAFLRRVRGAMDKGDRLLIGVDLRKDRRVLEPAYDDARGVTARFNKNILARINRELEADFDLDAFDHRAVYEETIGRIEMYLVSKRAQRVRIGALDLEIEFAAGEAMHTEDSYKYSPEELEALAGAAGLRVEELWFDSEKRFAEVMFVRD